MGRTFSSRSPLRQRRPVLFHLSVALGLALLATLGIWAGWSGPWTWPAWLAVGLGALNLTTFAYYGYDKWQARRGGRRVPERALHTLALLGGSIGAYAAMQTFRHKTIKGRFRIVFWLIVAVQVAVLVWIGREIWLRR